MKSQSNKLYAIRRNAFPLDYLSELKAQVLSSIYLGKGPFADSFVKTQGFSIVFTRTGLSEVENNFPYLKPFLANVLLNDCNAFFINSLILDGGSRVNPHIDCRILPDNSGNIIPNLVSVLYVQVPTNLQGGELVLETGNNNENILIQPQTNALIYFRGDLIHSVNQVHSLQQRISLVCEQYNLNEVLLQNFPTLKIISGYGAIV